MTPTAPTRQRIVRQPVHRMVARPVGWVLVGVSLLMVLTALVEILFGGFGTSTLPKALVTTLPLLIAAPLTATVGIGGWWWGRTVPRDIPLDRTEASVAVTLIWFLLGVTGGLPLMIGAGTSPVDAFFEAVSGYTTTGATIYGNIEGTLSPPLIMWRGVMHWCGGMGVVVLFVAIFPNIGVSGKHMFRSEVPAVTNEGLRPRIRETSLALYKIYVGLTVLCILALMLCGLPVHESIIHAFATLSTGGFSSKDASFGAFANPAADWVASFFMLVAGANFGLYYAALWTRRPGVLWKSAEFRAYLLIIGLAIGLITWSLLPLHDQNPLTTLRYATFRVATSLTSTGFGIDDHRMYPPLAMAVTLLLMVVGACAGSTAGGFKVARLVILVNAALVQARKSIRPGVVQVVRVDGRPVDSGIVLEVATFFFVYLAFLGLCTLGVVLLDGTPVPMAFGATLSALSNMGPIPFYTDADNYSGFSDAAKLLFSFAMIFGRLELFTVLAVFLPEVWRR
jgi:trk system potassium uptake protein TrkH